NQVLHMPVKSFMTTIMLLCCITMSSIGQTNTRNKININDNWKFHFGNAADPAKDFNYSIATIFSKSGGAARTAIDARFDDSKWRTLDLPHDWAVELPFVNSPSFDVESHGYKPVGGLFPETNIGWYRKHFTIAKADSGSRYQIQFDGVFRNATTWLNGFYLGTNLSGYIGTANDITDYIKFGADNVLTVRVDASQYEGWFYEGAGIYRDVWLNRFDNLHIADGGLFVHTEVKDKTAGINIETTVENKRFTDATCTVVSYVTSRDGKLLAQTKEQPLSLAVNGKGTVKQKLSISDPKLWSLNDPYLYRVVSVVKSAGKVVDTLKQRFGIRMLRFDATTGFFLNGKHLKILGVNNHQDHAGVGSAIPDQLQYYRIWLLKDMGVNACRTSHNPPTPSFLDACDSLGMLVLDETRLLNSSAEYISQFERMVLRDRNHPSIFLWSIGNEEGWIQTGNIGKRIAQTVLAKQKELDPSRTSTYAADVANVFNGVNEVIPIRGFNYRHKGGPDYHRDHPNQPILGTEMGSTVTTRGIYTRDSVKAYVADQDIEAPYWASKAEDWWVPNAENAYWLGGFVWTGFDYRGEPTPFKWPNINSHFGIMDMCGFPKNIYYYYQSWWTDKDVLHISPHWNWPDKKGQLIDVWVNTNADNIELFLNGKSLGKKDMRRNSHLQWSVNYEPGKLEAIAYKKGKRLYSKVETTGAPVEVVMTPYKTTILADNKDLSIINLSVVDKEGREVPDADNMISFTISGPGKIIGVGNGDPSSHEPDKYLNGETWQRNLFNGKCQVIVQSTGQPGAIKFEAKAKGLTTASTDIITVSTGSIASVTVDKDYLLKGEAAKPRESTKMLGADISFLPQLEDRGIKFSDNGVQKDALQVLKDHGFNYVRLRIFNDPARDGGYSKGKGFCDLAHTKQMAKRIKAAGMKFLLDFHYSDTWADPGKQHEPLAWKGQSFTALKKTLFDYTKSVIQELKDQGTAPDMVQIGNEINHGIVWPEGNITNIDSLSQLLAAGVAAVKTVDPSIIIMMHIALGGQNSESVFFFDELQKRKVPFDVIGLSYYPKWHGTLADLSANMDDLVKRYNKDIIVVEYSAKKEEVNKLAFELANGKGKGTCIWEPLNTWESVFDREGKSNDFMKVYDGLSKKYIEAKGPG
ncbi:MAG: Beta-galactosidase Arabinogalactan endo,4-beta-galactosidase, partial [Sediminibacterium sp.]|nr:Beta-galactosidase Arabinogalactan endo,4-beta-galactosidase [Sediminibacterium sp.]